MNNLVFSAYSRYYDLLYRDKDYNKEASYIIEALNRNGIRQGDILEYGSGTGKHGGLLARHGYCVHGIEQSAEMVALAHQGDGFTCQQGDICNVSMGRTYDAVLSLFHVVSYLTTNVSLQSLFHRAASHLAKGGVFIFDFWYSPAVLSQRPTVRVKRIIDTKVEITRIAEPSVHVNENRVDVCYTIFVRDLLTGEVQVLTENHPMRHFSLLELDHLAQVSGFERVHAEEFSTGKYPGEDTWGVCVTLRRI